jgi:hypothetical protein
MEIINENNGNGKDAKLWRIAQKRANFKKELFSYIVINAFLWLIWFYSSSGSWDWVPWPIWPTLGWGVGIAYSCFDAYHGNKNDMTQREYEKLKNQQKN